MSRRYAYVTGTQCRYEVVIRPGAPGDTFAQFFDTVRGVCYTRYEAARLIAHAINQFDAAARLRLRKGGARRNKARA